MSDAQPPEPTPTYEPPALVVLGSVKKLTGTPKPVGTGDTTSGFSAVTSDRALKRRVEPI